MRVAFGKNDSEVELNSGVVADSGVVGIR